MLHPTITVHEPAKSLEKYSNAKVVLLFLSTTVHTVPFFEGASRKFEVGKFVWLAGDTLTLLGYASYIDKAEGAIYFDHPPNKKHVCNT